MVAESECAREPGGDEVRLDPKTGIVAEVKPRPSPSQLLLRLYGARFFELVPGIYKKTSGGDYGTYAMNSANAPEWRAVDGGSWWLSDEPILEPNGDYSANCWLGMSAWNVTTSGLRFNDERFNNTCVVSSSSYVCSTNDKDFNDNAHPQYRPHEPDTPMLIQSAESFVAIAKELQRRQPPYHATLVADVVVDLGALAIPSSKTLHVISHPEATSRFSIQQADGTNSGIFHVKPNGVLQLEDVVLRKGRRQRGGAININSGSVELTNCLVANNTASSQGGGVYSNMGHVNLVNSTFEGNSAQSGGAVYSERGTLRTKNVLFEKNTATTHNGGAVYSQMGSVLLFNATLSKNRAKSGGAVYNDEAKLMLQQSRLELNTASHQGGAVYNRYGAITLESSGVDRNLGFHKGGAVYNHYGTLALNASTFQCNLAKWRAYDYHKLKITKFLGKRANDFNRLDRSGNAVYHRYHSDPAGHLCFACTENSTLQATQQDDVQHGDYYQYARRVMVPPPPPPPAPAPSPEAAANGEAPAPAPLQAAAPTYVWNATRRSAWCSGAVPHGTAATLAGCKALCTGGCTGIYTKADQTLELADIQLARVTGCEPQHVVRHAASPSRK